MTKPKDDTANILAAVLLIFLIGACTIRELLTPEPPKRDWSMPSRPIVYPEGYDLRDTLFGPATSDGLAAETRERQAREYLIGR